ncbi:hypothetical protein KAZ57_03870 [Patescibacteria group bacterium]|nr:hypothetical protein [Patescibacteria group bacterium]
MPVTTHDFISTYFDLKAPGNLMQALSLSSQALLKNLVLPVELVRPAMYLAYNDVYFRLIHTQPGFLRLLVLGNQNPYHENGFEFGYVDLGYERDWNVDKVLRWEEELEAIVNTIFEKRTHFGFAKPDWW